MAMEIACQSYHGGGPRFMAILCGNADDEYVMKMVIEKLVPAAGIEPATKGL
jgi:hypothetical protein